MIVVKSFAELQDARPELSGSLSLVPTMGALHAGHLSLIDIAHDHGDLVAATIFVNPTQFAPHEDLESYPRTLDSDLQQCEAKGVDLVYVPQIQDIYPEEAKADLQPGPAANGLESDHRPHFFGGVMSVVKRLFDQVKPDSAVFGEKDYQQLQVIQEMAKDQNLNINILPAPIIRDEYGLALSSRNAYLDNKQLTTARQLNAILFETARTLSEDCNEKQVLDLAIADIAKAGFNKVDYLDKRWNRLLVAAHIGSTRLIDNVAISR